MEEIEEVAIQIDDQPEISTKTNKGTKKLKGDEDSYKLVEELHNLMEKRLSALPGKPLQARSLTIFRLPGWIHENNKELCEPKMVAIGPYHHGKESLQTMEEHKWYTLRNFLARTDVGLKVCLQAMISIETQARNCYSEIEKIGSGDFVMMLLLDGCFILEWFMFGSVDTCLNVGWALADLLSDMLLQENQIPFFVIHELFAIVQGQNVSQRPNCEGQCPLVKLFSNLLREWSYLTQFKSSEIPCKRVDHLLHLCYTGVVPDSLPQTQSDQGNSDADKSNNICGLGSVLWSRLSNCCKVKKERSIPSDLVHAVDAGLPSLSELHDAGIKFKRKKNPTSMLDISFKNGTIEMPFIQIEVPKIRILWNMVAFEQSCMPRDLPQTLSSYLALMDTLIDTEKDVSILEQFGILDNLFQNAKEAATFFNQFDQIFSLDYSNHYFKGLFHDIREYSQSRWHRHRARLMQDYFSNPWSIISVVAAGVLLVLTILQTYYSAAN